MSAGTSSFSERDFYLAEFRGRSIGIALPAALPADPAPLVGVLDALAQGGTRTVLLGPRPADLGRAAAHVVDPARDERWIGALWRALLADPCAGVVLPERDFPRRCREIALRLRLAKLVWLDMRGSLHDARGERVSVVATVDLERMLDAIGPNERRSEAALLAEIHAMLVGGIPSVSLCRLEDLPEELFTYAGAGTFFTRERYAEVRPLALDEFSTAADLIARGVAEGFLAPRSASQIEAVLDHGFGVFIEGRYLAGIGALDPYPGSGVAEIVSLYTVTRFAGEGVGGHLVRFALESARESGFERVFACTTSERVEGFFLRHGFEPLPPDAVPEAKWGAYPADRRARVRCLGRLTKA